MLAIRLAERLIELLMIWGVFIVEFTVRILCLLNPTWRRCPMDSLFGREVPGSASGVTDFFRIASFFLRKFFFEKNLSPRALSVALIG